ncbi:hypothetical protein POPTR_002G184550v4 [Populus trichocarpa]|uniref:Uncharacterized protein n=1 Tax=Populus trichocarpa TaxID=3694 RepID=A0ACC0TFT7_POPTR|nr:hypothetical protein POPTR_002G184550v4 [Populus trichocarpa]
MEFDVILTYIWGFIMLTCLYKYLCVTCIKEATQVGRCLLLLQLWSWKHLLVECPQLSIKAIITIQNLGFTLPLPLRHK